MPLVSCLQKDPFRFGDRVYYWQVDKSKIKDGVTSGRWFEARVPSQEGAICLMDTGTTVLRVNQSKLRKEKVVEPPTDHFPRGRSDLQSDSKDKDQSAPSVYWVGPQHATVDVLDLSDGLSLFSSICNQRGLLTGERMTLK